MSDYVPETALQDAITVLLTASPAVNALVRGRVYDETPEDDITFPYIYLEAMNSKRMEVGCGNPCTVTMRWYCVSGNEFGRLIGWQVASAMVDALNNVWPTLPEGFRVLSEIRHVQTLSVIDPDAVKAVAVDIVCDVSRTKTGG